MAARSSVLASLWLAASLVLMLTSFCASAMTLPMWTAEPLVDDSWGAASEGTDRTSLAWLVPACVVGVFAVSVLAFVTALRFQSRVAKLPPDVEG